MSTLKSETPEFLSSKEDGTFLDNETYVKLLRNDTIRSPEEGRALAEAALYAAPVEDLHSYERAEIASLHEQSAVEMPVSYDQLSEQAISARILQIRKEMLKGTRQDFDLAV
jgi:hypothetical protein